MAVKDLFRRMRPVQLYVMLALTVLFFLAELVVSHVTHALTLLVDSYHMLCNLIALLGCIATVKYGGEEDDSVGRGEDEGGSEEAVDVSGGKKGATNNAGGRSGGGGCGGRPGAALACIGGSKAGSSEALPSRHLVSERRLRNTFGWARIDVLVLLIGSVFLASLCFSLVVEALQTLFHIGHSDEMHHPIPVLCVGAVGVLLNGLCYLLIGGYTFHQGSFLHVTSSGDVVLEGGVLAPRKNVVAAAAAQQEATAAAPAAAVVSTGGGSTTAVTKAAVATSYLQAGVSGTPPLRQGPREMLRDVLGCFLVIICSLVVYFTDANVAKYADPIISIISAVLLLILSYPYMKESGLILLQTIPDHINIESLRVRLCHAFKPSVVGVENLHIWQLTPHRTYATAHVVFMNSKEISSVMKAVTEFFHEQGISHVTIQPEFLTCRAKSASNAETNGRLALPSAVTTDNALTAAEGGVKMRAGRGESCRSLQCCDEGKGVPLALPQPGAERRHSLDEVVIPQEPQGGSSVVAEVGRRAVSEEALLGPHEGPTKTSHDPAGGSRPGLPSTDTADDGDLRRSTEAVSTTPSEGSKEEVKR
ncbi:zinc transporter 1 isoform X2 [Ischnura elegans]|uniref:zinc transporter 1 isoform X2 n=1 Tax=Ischnura elegans TaxID=197161 RepID=UPI001ED8AF55|nr:zinc transporter 1 isoform X2 [Ischnura elegans]